MPTILTDEEVFGPATPAAKPIAPGTILSDADVFGLQGGIAPEALGATRQPRSRSRDLTIQDVGEAMKGGLQETLAFGKRLFTEPKKVAIEATREGMSITDLLTTGRAQMATDIFAQTVGRVVAGAQGGSRKQAIEFGKEFGSELASNPIINRPLTKMFDWVMNNSPEGTTVDAAMEKVTDMIHKGGLSVQKETRGAIRADDVDLGAEAIMFGAGTKAVDRLVGGKKRPGQPEPLPQRGTVPKTIETPSGRIINLDETTPAGRGVKDAAEASTGLADWEATHDPSKARGVVRRPKLTPEETAAKDKARLEEVQKTFDSDPAYADYLRNYAEEEARQRTLGTRRVPGRIAPEVAAGDELISAIDAGGVPLNPARLRRVAEDLGLEVSKDAAPEATIQRIRDAVERGKASGIDTFERGPTSEISARGGMPGRAARATRTGSTDAFTPEELPPGRTPPVETGAPSSLDSAIAKIRGGRRFDLTPEERIAMRDTTSSFGRPPLLDERGVPLKQKGTITPDMQRLIAGLGLGGALAAYAYHIGDSDIGLAALGLGTIEGARHSFGPLLRDSGYTLKTLERFPKGKTELTREQVLQTVNRPDVSKAEKDLVLGILGDREKISATDMVRGFHEQTKAMELMPTETPAYADYGLDAIDRRAEESNDWRRENFFDHGEPPTGKEVPVRTTVYRSPIETFDRNHFEDLNYFAHTRSFDEEGVRHVVEIQSDLAQHAKSLPEAERAKTQEHLDYVNRVAAALDKTYVTIGDVSATSDTYVKALNKLEKVIEPHILLDFKLSMGQSIVRELINTRKTPAINDLLNQFRDLERTQGIDAVYDETKAYFERASVSHPGVKGTSGEYLEPLANVLTQVIEKQTKSYDLLAQEHQAKLGASVPKQLEPMLKNWHKRIVREELSGDGVRREIDKAMTRLGDVLDHPVWRKFEGGISREEKAAPLHKQISELENTLKNPVRFATADTVAKVEGWPTRNWEDEVRNGETALKKMAGAETHPVYQRQASDLEHARRMLAEQGPGEHIMHPEHQGIYDRYKGEIEKFLRNDLKAKPHTDSKGHTWLEVPPQPRGPKQMFGRADTASMAALAAFVGGATAMQAWSDNPSLVKDVVAGLIASAATGIRPKKLVEIAREARTARPLETVAKAGIERDGNIRLAALDISNTVREVAKLVPSEAGRERVHTALDTGRTASLTPNERKAYDHLQAEYKRYGQLGLDADTLKATRQNYATHMWKADEGLFEKLFGRRLGSGGSPNTPYALHRMFATIEEGEKAGLVPLTKDAAAVFSIYANSLITAVENGKMLKTIVEQKTASGDKLILPANDAPRGYERIDSPQLRGKLVHPEVTSQMKFFFENPSAAGATAVAETIADVSKRSSVSGSLFHTKALIDVLIAAVPPEREFYKSAAVGAGAGYLASLAAGDDREGRDMAIGGMLGYVGPRVKTYATARNMWADEMKKGSNSPFITRAIKSGLTFGSEKGALVVDDAGRKFYDAMRWVQKQADFITQPIGIKGGKPVELYIKANHAMDDVLWGRMHPAMKLETWSKTSNILVENSAKRNAKDPRQRVLSEEEADQIASRYTNDLFGGLNWTRIAMESRTRFGRMVAQSLLSPRGRKAMRIAMFAPDWTISTARSALAAVDKDLINPLKWGNVARGMFEPVTRGDLARQYVARSALYYLIVGDAINYSMSGHHLWENDDKIGMSFIDWGDGRKMQFSKHIMETPHWLDHPLKQALGKMGFVPKEIASQVLSVDYLAPKEGKSGQVFAGPKMQDTSLMGRAGHALGGFTPIPFQDELSDATVWGFGGMPLYGKTDAQREAQKILRAEKKRTKEK